MNTTFDAFTSFDEYKTSATFSIHNTDVFLPVALRRIILTEVETIAIGYDPYDENASDITIKENTGCIHNEWLSHRLSLIPLFFTRKEIETFDSSKIEFKLQVSCEKKGVHSDVTTKAIKVFLDGKEVKDAAKRLFPPDSVTGDHIIITRLRWTHLAKRESINIIFKARKGNGHMHTRWCPTSKCSYTYDDEHPSDFTFYIESVCGLSPFDIVDIAFEKLIGKLELVKLRLEDLSDSVISQDGSWQLELPGESSILGGFIQAGIDVLTPEAFEFCGYHHPHPLMNKVIIKFKGGSALVLEKCIDAILTYVSDTRKKFNDQIPKKELSASRKRGD